MDKTIRVGAVSYLNTKPLIYAFKHGYEVKNMQLMEDYPARVAEKLLSNEIDVGLVPVAIIPKLNEHYIITDYCVGAEGPVASVCIFSEVPIEKTETIILDYQSRTSVALAKVLLKHYWKITPKLEDAKENYIDRLKGPTAGVVIGDRALQQRHKSKYIYDLAEAWINLTKLPFVFAAWIANKQLPESFITAFNHANKVGLQNIPEVVNENAYAAYNLTTYYSKNISYDLTDRKREGLRRFLELLQGL